MQQENLGETSDETRDRHGTVCLACSHNLLRARTGKRKAISTRTEERTGEERTCRQGAQPSADSGTAETAGATAEGSASGSGTTERPGQANRKRKIRRRQTTTSSAPTTTASRQTAATTSRATRKRPQPTSPARRRQSQCSPHPRSGLPRALRPRAHLPRNAQRRSPLQLR